MDGVRITLPITFVDSTAPVLPTYDPIETEGSLVLIEPAHPAEAWAAGTPTHGMTVPNILGEFCADVVGNAGDMTLHLGDSDGGKALVERSDKGGVHFVPSRTTATTLTRFYVELADAVKTYLLTNDDHQYYMSFWGRKTRLEVSSANSLPHTLASASGATSHFLMYQREVFAGYSASGGGELSGIARATGPYRGAVYSSAWTGTKPASNAQFVARFLASGFTVLGQAVANVADWLMYRAYIEDLTVSGRTPTEVNAIDDALYTEHVLTSGGRYYGDTYTDPATIP